LEGLQPGSCPHGLAPVPINYEINNIKVCTSRNVRQASILDIPSEKVCLHFLLLHETYLSYVTAVALLPDVSQWRPTESSEDLPAFHLHSDKISVLLIFTSRWFAIHFKSPTIKADTVLLGYLSRRGRTA
jgi:hypothetical protein